MTRRVARFQLPPALIARLRRVAVQLGVGQSAAAEMALQRFVDDPPRVQHRRDGLSAEQLRAVLPLSRALDLWKRERSRRGATAREATVITLSRLARQGMKISRTKLYRMSRAYAAHGLAGLVDGRTKARAAKRRPTIERPSMADRSTK